MNKIISFFQSLRISIRVMVLALLAISSWFIVVSCSVTNAGQYADNMAPDVIADYIYRIIKSERTIYGKYVVQRLKDENVIRASEHWEQDKSLPLPAQMFRMTAELASENSPFNYGSISPWSLNEGNMPNTDFEKKAMENVLNTGLPFKDYQTKDGKKYFSAVYPDKAVAASCVDCHNSHPIHKQRYPEKVFKVGDVMGGIIINLPLDRQ